MPDSDPLIQKHGGYRKLKSFRMAQLVYDITVRFCQRYIPPRSRTHDQMVQAARSGVQNIAEGSQASGTSRKTELKLTNVARASLEELRLDYEDFLRQKGLAAWHRSDPRRQELIDRRCETADQVAIWVKEICGRSGLGGLSGQSARETGRDGAPGGTSTPSTSSTQPPAAASYSEASANAALTLIAVATGLLDRQLASLAKAFEEEGGFTERLYRVRSKRRRGE